MFANFWQCHIFCCEQQTQVCAKPDDLFADKEKASPVDDVKPGYVGHNINKWLISERVQNSTLEERVELLEIQEVVIQDEVSDLETDVDFLFDEQIIQDERLFSLEQQLISVNEDIESNLQIYR